MKPKKQDKMKKTRRNESQKQKTPMLFEGMGAAQGLVTSLQTWSIPYSVRYMIARALTDTVIAYGVSDMIARALIDLVTAYGVADMISCTLIDLVTAYGI
jgi:hypothetical protein